MSRVIAHDHEPIAESERGSDLRKRIGWICHGVRIGAVIWIGWVLVMVCLFWGDKAGALEVYGRALGVDLSGVSAGGYAAAASFVAIDWCVAAVVAVCIWQLFGTYLAGRVFSVDAAVWLRRTGTAIIAAVVVDMAARLAIASIFAGHLTPAAVRGFLVLPQDLLHMILGLFVLLLAHIFKAAAEMAEDHAQIV